MSTFQLTSSNLTTKFQTLLLIFFFVGSIHFTATAAHYQNVIEMPTVEAPTALKLCAQPGQTVSFSYTNTSSLPMYLPTIKIYFQCSNMNSSKITGVPTIAPYSASQTMTFTVPSNANLSLGGHLVLKILTKDSKQYIKLIELSNCIGNPRPVLIE